MAESLVFHFVFAIFIVWLFVWWLSVHAKINDLQTAVFPVLLLKKISFPQNRSITVRAAQCLQKELSAIFNCKIQINFKLENKAEYRNFLTDLCYLIYKNNDEKLFLVDGQCLSANELALTITNTTQVGLVKFDLNPNDFVWSVHIK